MPDRTTETLDFRKRRLLTRMQTKPPFVLEYLKRLFDSLLGENMHEITLDKLLFEIESVSFYAEAEKTLERILPLNIFYRIISGMQSELYFAMVSIVGEETTIYPWRPSELNLTANLNLGTVSQSHETLTVYSQN